MSQNRMFVAISTMILMLALLAGLGFHASGNSSVYAREDPAFAARKRATRTPTRKPTRTPIRTRTPTKVGPAHTRTPTKTLDLCKPTPTPTTTRRFDSFGDGSWIAAPCPPTITKTITLTATLTVEPSFTPTLTATLTHDPNGPTKTVTVTPTVRRFD